MLWRSGGGKWPLLQTQNVLGILPSSNLLLRETSVAHPCCNSRLLGLNFVRPEDLGLLGTEAKLVLLERLAVLRLLGQQTFIRLVEEVEVVLPRIIGLGVVEGAAGGAKRARIASFANPHAAETSQQPEKHHPPAATPTQTGDLARSRARSWLGHSATLQLTALSSKASGRDLQSLQPC